MEEEQRVLESTVDPRSALPQIRRLKNHMASKGGAKAKGGGGGAKAKGGGAPPRPPATGGIVTAALHETMLPKLMSKIKFDDRTGGVARRDRYVNAQPSTRSNEEWNRVFVNNLSLLDRTVARTVAASGKPANVEYCRHAPWEPAGPGRKKGANYADPRWLIKVLRWSPKVKKASEFHIDDSYDLLGAPAGWSKADWSGDLKFLYDCANSLSHANEEVGAGQFTHSSETVLRILCTCRKLLGAASQQEGAGSELRGYLGDIANSMALSYAGYRDNAEARLLAVVANEMPIMVGGTPQLYRALSKDDQAVVLEAKNSAVGSASGVRKALA